MLLGVEGLGFPSRPLARPSPYFVRDLRGGGAFESGVQSPYLGFG